MMVFVVLHVSALYFREDSMFELTRHIFVHVVMKWDFQMFLKVVKGVLSFPMCFFFVHTQCGKEVFSQPSIVQILPLRKMRKTCDFPHRYTSII